MDAIVHTDHHKSRTAPLVRQSAPAEQAAERGAEIRKRFHDANVSIAAWAKARGFSTALVYEILQGKRRCLRGESRRIAVALGLKEGTLEVTAPADFDPRVKAKQ